MRRGKAIRWQLRRRSSNAFSCPLCRDILLKFSLECTMKKLKRNGDLLITNKVNAGSERQDITSISHLATRRKAGMQFLEHIFQTSQVSLESTTLLKRMIKKC